MPTQKKRYKLKALIYKKYGAKKFSIACEIVARWVAFDTRKPCTMEDVLAWCDATVNDSHNDVYIIMPYHFTALSRLFSLNNNETKFFNK